MTKEEIYEAADKVEAALAAMKPGSYSPSVIARKAHISTSLAQQALTYMDGEKYVEGSGNGAWRRFCLPEWRRNLVRKVSAEPAERLPARIESGPISEATWELEVFGEVGVFGEDY